MKWNIGMAEMQDEHLNIMIKLAFDMEDAEEVQRILDMPEPELSTDDEVFANAIFSKAWDSTKKQEKKRKIQQSTAVARRVFIRIVEVVACIVLIAAIAMPVAVAGSAAFRAKVMQLLMQLDNEKGEAYFRFSEDKSVSVWVPESWPGSYFPSYIPDGYKIFDFDPSFASVEYRDANNHQLFFDECTEDTTMMSGTDNSEIGSIIINGQAGYLIDGIAADGITHAVTLVWQSESNWFVITGFGLSTNEVITVATSVKCIR